MSNGLDPDQDRRSVGPDLDLHGLQRLLADDKSRRWRGTIGCAFLSLQVERRHRSGCGNTHADLRLRFYQTTLLRAPPHPLDYNSLIDKLCTDMCVLTMHFRKKLVHNLTDLALPR